MEKLNFSSIMIGTADPKPLAKFYEQVLGRKADWEDSKYYVWQFGGSGLTIGEHSEVKGENKEPARIIINLETKNVKEEFERIKDIDGVKVIKEPYSMGEDENMQIATLADPDGNYFQLATPWEDDSED